MNALARVGFSRMITTEFFDLVADYVVVAKRLVILFNNKIITTVDFPASTTMTKDDVDSYIAGKLNRLFVNGEKF